MFCRHVFGNISGGFRIFGGNFAGFRRNTWISRDRDRAKYQKPCIGCYFEVFSLKILVFSECDWSSCQFKEKENYYIQHYFEVLYSHGQVHPFGTFESFQSDLVAGSIFHLIIIKVHMGCSALSHSAHSALSFYELKEGWVHALMRLVYSKVPSGSE